MTRSILECRTYQRGDLDKVDALPAFRIEREWVKDGEPYLDRPPHQAWTMTRDGEPVACAGITPEEVDGATVAGLWGFVGSLSLREWAVIDARVRDQIRLLRERHGLKRLYSTARADNPKARAYLARLGFVDLAPFLAPNEGDEYLMMERVL
jgi:hypothetical protein